MKSLTMALLFCASVPCFDVTVLTPQKAGGSVGATVGLHAHLDSHAP